MLYRRIGGYVRVCACAYVILTPVKYNGGLNYIVVRKQGDDDAVQSRMFDYHPAQ